MDAQGNMYVMEASDQILKYDKAGNFVTKWGSREPGTVNWIRGPAGI